MSKQDVTYSRTAEDLERKYNLGQIAQGGTGGDSGKISQALQELSDCKATISNMLRKISEIESQLGEGGNIVYLTQNEYDALPDSKYTDDVEYRITDAGIGETQASNVSYDNSNSGLEAINTQSAIDLLKSSLEWKFLGQTIGKEALILPADWNELYILVSVGASANGYVEFTPKKMSLYDTTITIFGGRTAVGDSGKRYNRGVAINISKTVIGIAEVMYTQGASYNASDTNVTNEAQMFVYYR